MDSERKVDKNDQSKYKNDSLILAQKSIEQLHLKHIPHFISYELSEHAFAKPPATNFMRNLDKISYQEREFQNGEANFLSLLEQVKEKGCHHQQYTVEETKEGIHKLFKYFEENTPVTSAPYEEQERKVFYDKLSKGYSYISNVISQEYFEKRLDEEQLYSCLEMIGEGANFCAGRWRQVLDELVLGFSDKIKGKEEVPNSKDRVYDSIKECFYKARSVIASQLSEGFVNQFYSDIPEASRLHYVSFFQRHLNQEYHFNLPITEEKDPFIEEESQYISSFADYFLLTKDLDTLILETTIENLKERIQQESQFYEEIVDAAKLIYRKKNLGLVRDDVVEFLAEDFFEGYSREIKRSALMMLLQEKSFIKKLGSLKIDEKKASDYLKNILCERRWDKLEACLMEGGRHLEKNPLLNIPLETEKRTTSLLSYLIAKGQYELSKKIIQWGADVEQEDRSPCKITGSHPSTPVFVRRPLHMAVIQGEEKMVNLLLENGADPFKGKILDGDQGFTPFELALREKRFDLVDIFIRATLQKDKDQRVEVPNGEVPLLNYLITKRLKEQAQTVINAGANLKAEERTKHDSDHQPSIYAIQGRNSMHLAIEMGEDDLIKLMLEKGSDPFDGKIQFGSKGKEIYYSPFDYAVIRRRWNIIEFFLEQDRRTVLNHKVLTRGGEKPLLNILIEKGENKLAEKMIRLGSNLNEKDNVNQKTPLHVAILHGKEDLVKSMIEKGRNPFFEKASVSGFFYTPFELAVKEKNFRMVDLILKLGEEKDLSFRPLKGLKIEFEEGNTPILSYLLARGYKKAAKELVIDGVDVNECDVTEKKSWGDDTATPIRGRAPLHVAVMTGDKKMVKLLLDRGANRHEAIRTGMLSKLKPSELALKLGFEEIDEMMKGNHGKNKTASIEKTM
jgi:ankyrin repeat protein